MSELPENWVAVAIGEVCNLMNGRAFKPTEWTTSGLPIVRIQNLNNPNAIFNYFDGVFEDRYHLWGGELLFAWSGTPGTSFGAHVWRGKEAVLNQHIFKVDFNENLIDKRFFHFAINEKLTELIGIAHGGVGLRHITKGKFEETKFLLPPLLEQKRIADKLEELLAKTTSSLEKLNRASALVKRFKQSVLAAATSGALTKDWREKNGVSSEWETRKIGDLILDLRYGTAKKSEYVVLDGSPVLRIPNIINGYIDDTDLKYSQIDIKEYEALCLQIGDVLVIRSNGSVELVGKSAIVSKSHVGYLFAGYLIRLRPNPALLDSNYLNQYLASPKIRSHIEFTARSSSGVNNINSEELKAILFPLPSLSEQLEIVTRVEKLFAFAARLEERIQTSRIKLEKFTPALLAKAFRGELVPQDPTDEPAGVLLERIKAARAAQEAVPKQRKPRTIKVKSVRAGGDTMKRLEDISKDYLNNTIRIQNPSGLTLEAKALWQVSELNIDLFYQQLGNEISAGLLRISSEKPTLVEAA